MKSTFQSLLGITLFVVCLPVSAQQNLISNPGFEEVEKYEYTREDNGKQVQQTGERLKYWFGSMDVLASGTKDEHSARMVESARQGSIDYHNNAVADKCRCTYMHRNVKTYTSEPRTVYAYSGNGKTGIGLYSNFHFPGDDLFNMPPSPGNLYYLKTKLKQPLKAGSRYYLEFYIFYAQPSAWSLTNMGALFTKDSANDAFSKMRPQVLCTDMRILAGGENWQKISGHFTAQGDEQFMTVGSFKFEPLCLGEGRGIEGSEIVREAYYYFDDFLLTEELADTLTEYKNVEQELHPNLVSNGGFEENITRIGRFNVDSLQAVSPASFKQFLADNNYKPEKNKRPATAVCTNERGPGQVAFDWYQPLGATPDFLRNTGTAHSGSGEVGLVLYSCNRKTFYTERFVQPEYITTPLTKPLEAGKNYYVEFYVKLDNDSRWCPRNIGAYFTTSDITDPAKVKLTNEPQLLWTDTNLLTGPHTVHKEVEVTEGSMMQMETRREINVGSYEWRKLSGIYKATGDELYMTVGCFYYPENERKEYYVSDKNHYYKFEQWEHPLIHTAYYHMDDFLITDNPDLVARQMERDIKPVNITLLVDVSASMYKNKYIDSLKAQLVNYVRGPGKKARITLITYGTKTEVLWNNKVVDDIAVFEKMLGSFHESGATLTDPAIAKAYALADSVYDASVRNEVILFTDAVFELNKKSVNTIKREAKNLQIEFAVYQYGSHENKALEEVLKACRGYYVNHRQQDMEQLIVHKSVLKKKHAHP